ncbi:hypothetical protein RND71_022581 [Anisodus tanguticus]|uniref:Eukaryotic translation initiation factor isoform 4E n=1 Tax=Anisodus tanguticus TaxID=243964 RepID=A0AAE1RSC5_9SOLA|nr:hypothetical protein RND71_022581 [Anisodus tanguticus]
MTTESPPVEATEVPPVTAAETAETKQAHKLNRKWTFWFDNQSRPKQGAAWGSSLRKAYTFETVEEFWSLYDQIFKPSKLTVNAEFHLFKAGIEPKWEDPECANGGKWTAMSSRKANLETMWLETLVCHGKHYVGSFLAKDAHILFAGWAPFGQLMALVGEQFDGSAEDICGVVASVRVRSQDKLSLWTKTATNEAAQMGIGRKWKEIIDTEKISYSFHDDSKRERSTKSRYTV